MKDIGCLGDSYSKPSWAICQHAVSKERERRRKKEGVEKSNIMVLEQKQT
jgi:hypothetical protein